IYGAMRGYARALDQHNGSHVKALNTFASAATKILAAGASAAPTGGAAAAAAVQAVGDAALLGADHSTGNKWNKDELDQAIVARFGVEVKAVANNGFLPRLSRK